MRVCPTCGELFDSTHAVCALDGSVLVAWTDSRARLTQVSGSRGVPPRPGSGDGVVIAEAEPVNTAPEVGRMLGGRYRLKAQIGVGGFGVVFSADDMRLQKRVAVKILSPRVAESDEAVERFRREALAASAVRHESIVDVTDFDIDEDGTRFIVMEYLDGVDLADVLDHESVIDPARALYIASQAASALSAAHDAGILHRDLKPANIYLTMTKSRRDFVKIIDFGISKVTQQARGDVSLTSSQLVMGTPHYMSHEQARGLELDGRSDVYGLGVILYEMLVGTPPFQGRTPIEILTNAAMTAAPPPSQARPDLLLPEGLDDLVLRALARDREARYSTMEGFGDAIGMWLQELDPALAGAINSGRQIRMYTPVPTPPPAVKPPSTLEHSSGEIKRAFAIAPPEKKRSRALWMVPLFLLAVAGSAVVVKFAMGGDQQQAAKAEVPEEAKERTTSGVAGAEPDRVAPPMAEPDPPEVEIRKVMVKLPANVPEDTKASAVRENGDNHDLPGEVEFERGSPLTVTVRVEGYKELPLTLNDDTPGEMVLDGLEKLEPVKKPKKSRNRSARNKTKSSKKSKDPVVPKTKDPPRKDKKRSEKKLNLFDKW